MNININLTPKEIADIKIWLPKLKVVRPLVPESLNDLFDKIETALKEL